MMSPIVNMGLPPRVLGRVLAALHAPADLPPLLEGMPPEKHRVALAGLVHTRIEMTWSDRHESLLMENPFGHVGWRGTYLGWRLVGPRDMGLEERDVFVLAGDDPSVVRLMFRESPVLRDDQEHDARGCDHEGEGESDRDSEEDHGLPL
jgi:hypothetical protein